LGGRHGSESVDEVLVVWFSRNPRTGKAVIVGWYEHATVYRIFRKPRRGEGHSLYGEPISYKAKARYRDCKLLNDTDSDRSFPIPNRFEKAGGYGQSANWYGLGTDFLEKVWKYILDLDGSHKATRPGKPTAPPVNNDPILKLLVEQNAIRVATEFYNSPAGGSRKVESVERENLGWDLDAIGEHDTLKVEVKGVSAQEPIAELTPNEFARMNEHNSFWVLFIVTNCLSQKPKSFEFRYMHDANRWETADGGILSIRQKVAAVVTLMPS
jgi:hypothetical protein